MIRVHVKVSWNCCILFHRMAENRYGKKHNIIILIKYLLQSTVKFIYNVQVS